MADVQKFGQGRENRPNPLVELHEGFDGSNGPVPAYVNIVKFTRPDGKWKASRISVTVSRIPDLIADLKAAYETALDGDETLDAG